MLDPAEVRRFIAEGGQVLRDGERLIVLGGCLDEGALAKHVVPRITAEDALAVREILVSRAGHVHFINTPTAAESAVRTLFATPRKILGFDTETTPLAKYRAPFPVTFTQKGELCKRQPQNGAAGAALDPYRSEVRLVQLFGQREDGVFVFDMTRVPWSMLNPLLESSRLIAANATFDAARLLQQGIEPKTIGDPFHLASLAFGLVPGSSQLSLATLHKKGTWPDGSEASGAIGLEHCRTKAGTDRVRSARCGAGARALHDAVSPSVDETTSCARSHRKRHRADGAHGTCRDALRQGVSRQHGV